MRKAYIYAALAILCWASVSTAFKIALRSLSPLGLLFFSSLSALILLGIVNIGLAFRKGTWSYFTLSTKQLYRSLISGMLNPFLYYLVLFEAYNRLRAQEAQVLNYTWAIVLSIFAAILLKKRLKLSDLLALSISFVGVLLIATKGDLLSAHFDDAWGTILAVGSSIIWSLYWIINMQEELKLSLRLMYNFLFGTLFISCYYLFITIFRGQCPLLFIADAILWSALLPALYVGVFEMGLTFLIWNKALNSTSNTARITNLIFITPFISLMLISLILREAIHSSTWWGLVAIVIGNVMQQFFASKDALTS